MDKKVDIDNWYKSKKIFFGFAIIRSGTTFLANFLNSAMPNAAVAHEAILSDYWSYPKAYASETHALEYLRDFRRNEIFYRNNGLNINFYGEINPFLRRHAMAVREIFPEAKFFHLIRDGRDVVRSIMSRATLDNKDPWSRHIYPKPGDRYFNAWKDMNRFEKVCWLWQEDNKYLRESIGYTVKFENLVSDYEYFKEKLLDNLGLELTKDAWQKYVARPNNPTNQFKFPHWRAWSKLEQETFNRICGEEMRASGYEMNIAKE